MLSKKEARKKAEKGLRFDFGGNLLHLGKLRYCKETKNYTCFILISYPRLPQSEDEELSYDNSKVVGEITINAETHGIYHTPEKFIHDRVGEIKKEGEVKFNKYK